MKKMILPIIFGLLLLAGCAPKAIPVEEAADLFVEQLVYQKEDTDFEDNFQNGADLKKGFEKNTTAFRDTFATGLVAADGDVSEETANEITALLMDKVKSATDYQIKVGEAEDGDSIRNVTYQVHGLDLVTVMKQTTQLVTAEMLKNTTLAKDEAKLQTETVKQLKHVLEDPPVKAEAVNVMLEMKPEKGQWVIVGGQQAQLEGLYLAFVAGVKDADTLSTNWQAAQAELTKELEKQLQK